VQCKKSRGACLAGCFRPAGPSGPAYQQYWWHVCVPQEDLYRSVLQQDLPLYRSVLQSLQLAPVARVGRQPAIPLRFFVRAGGRGACAAWRRRLRRGRAGPLHGADCIGGEPGCG
jgi:hypothetical protein